MVYFITIVTHHHMFEQSGPVIKSIYMFSNFF